MRVVCCRCAGLAERNLQDGRKNKEQDICGEYAAGDQGDCFPNSFRPPVFDCKLLVDAGKLLRQSVRLRFRFNFGAQQPADRRL